MLLTYESVAYFRPRWSPSGLFGLAAGVLNLLLILGAIGVISRLNDPNACRLCSIVLLLETAPVAFLCILAVAGVLQSGGRLRQLIPAVLGSFFASSSGIIVAVAGALFAVQPLLPVC